MFKLSTNSIAEVVSSRMCHGCGTCAYSCNSDAIELKNIVNIGIRPVVDASKCTECNECVAVCSGIQLQHDMSEFPSGIQRELESEWGPVLELWEGHAGDPEIRFKGGSGGVATALAAFAIEQLDCSGALHVGMNPTVPYLNEVVLSTHRNDLIHRAGSRYAPAAVGGSLAIIEKSDRPCVLIGKPCDVASARMAARIRPRLKENISFTVAIFCGGTPSTRGTFKLLEELGIDKSDVESLRFRGHGWPGMTGVSLKSSADGKRIEMTYARAWDTILTKHKPFRCHICPDGTGEFADLACGDPWYREVRDGEHGSSLIVVRTERGREILRQAMHAGYIAAKPVANDLLPKSQLGLLLRRRGILPKLVAMYGLRMTAPRYSGFHLWQGWMRLGLQRKWSTVARGLRWVVGLWRNGSLRIDGEECIDAEGRISFLPAESKGCRS